MSDDDKVLARVLDEATAFLGGLDQRSVAPRADVDQVAAALGGPLPAEGGPTDDGLNPVCLPPGEG